MLKILRRGSLLILVYLGFFPLTTLAEESSFDLEPIVITKSSVHLILPYSLDSEDLEVSPFSSAVEALSLTPLDLQSRSPHSGIQTDFSLRGSTFQGVLMLLDGQRINDPQTAHHNSDIPLTKEDILKLEVTPGVSSSVFGPDAIGGAVNFILKKPQDKKRVLELSGGQFNTFSGLFSASDKFNDLGVRISLENQESAGFYTDTDFKKLTANLASSLDIPDGEYDFSFGYQEKEFGAYDFYTPGLDYQSKEWTKTYLFNTGLKLDKEGFLIKPNFLWRRHYDKFLLDKTLQRSRYLNHHYTDVYTPNIYFQKELALIGRLGLGLEWGQEKIKSTNLGKHSRSHKSIFLDDSLDILEDLSLGLSFRADDFSGFDGVYTGSSSLKYKFKEKNSIRLSVSRSMRLPSFTELYYNDPVTLGNSGLSSEKSLNYEAGYEFKNKEAVFGLTVFLRQEKDFIDWVKHSSSQAKWQAENITQASALGFEERIKIELVRNLSLDTNYTYINKRIDDQGLRYKYGPNYSRHIFNTSLCWELPFGTQEIGFTYKKKPDRDGWFLLDTSASYNLNPRAKLFLKASNLLNVEYQEIEGIPSPGRWVEGGLRLEW